MSWLTYSNIPILFHMNHTVIALHAIPASLANCYLFMFVLRTLRDILSVCY